MYFAILLFTSAAAATDFSEISVDDTQTLLKDWGLHEYLGRDFKRLSYDGRIMDLLEMADFANDREQFPDATAAHWKLLLRQINLKRVGHISRRKLAKIDTTGFVGVDLKKDNSIITFGEKSEIRLFRSGPGVLTVDAKSVNFGQISATKILLNGKDLSELFAPIPDLCAKKNGGCDPRRKCTNSAKGATCGKCPDPFIADGPKGCQHKVCLQTLSVFSKGCCKGHDARFTLDGKQISAVDRRGLNVMYFKKSSGKHVKSGFKSFDTYGSTSATASMVNYIKSIPYGAVVAIGAQDSAESKMTADGYKALRMVGGSGTNLQFRKGYAVIGRRGMLAGAALETEVNQLEVTLSTRFSCDDCFTQLRVKSAGYNNGNSASFYLDGKKLGVKVGRGLTVAFFKTVKGKLQLEQQGTYDTYGNAKADDSMAAFIKGIPAGRVVAVASADSAEGQLSGVGYGALRSVGGSGNKHAHRSGFVLIGRKGMLSGEAREVGGVKKSSEDVTAVFTCNDCVQLIKVQSAGLEHGNHVKVFVDGKQMSVKAGRGLTAVSFRHDKKTGKLVMDKQGTYDTYGNSKADDQMAAFIKAVPSGRVVVVAALDSAEGQMSTVGYNALKSIGGTGAKLAHRSGFALVGRKGLAAGKGYQIGGTKKSAETIIASFTCQNM